MRPEKFAGGIKYPLASGPSDFNTAAMADARGNVHKGIVRMSIGDPVDIPRTCTGAQALQGENAGLDRGLMNRDNKSVDVDLRSEIR